MEQPCYDRSSRGIVSIALLMCAFTAFGQLTVDNSRTPEELVRDILLGQGVSVSNIRFNGSPGNVLNDQIGSFNGPSNLGLTSGILLATGNVRVVEGPNDAPDATQAPTNPVWPWSPEPDLARLYNAPTLTTLWHRDPAILEFDLIPIGDSIKFRFVFGSEEYPEYVCSSFNDVFGLILSGPGINGPFWNNGVNLALIPGKNVPIAINTVNPGVVGEESHPIDAHCFNADPFWYDNSIHYRDNTNGTTHQLDGSTVPLLASAAVQCGETYHIKIAIADLNDPQYDSAVFLERGSLTSPGIAMTLLLPTAHHDTLAEGCGTATLLIERQDTSDEQIVDIELTGEGITVNDVSEFPSQVVFPSGTTSVSIDFHAVSDGLDEGAEALTISGTTYSICGDPISISVSLVLVDYDPVTIIAEDIVLQCDRDSVDVAPMIQGGFGSLSLSWNTGSTAPVIRVPGKISGQYTLNVADECPRTATATVEVISGCSLVIPNVFSPNSDGLNDRWIIEGIEGVEHTVRVYNRWGRIVLETSDYNNDWDGNGASDGTYFYEVRSMEPELRTYTGTLTILRNGRK